MQENQPNISLIKRNILNYLDEIKTSKAEFYRQSGVSRGTLDNTSGMSEDSLLRFVKFAPEVNTAWLLSGDGDMINDNILSGFTYDGSAAKPPVLNDPMASYGSIPLLTKDTLTAHNTFKVPKKDVLGQYYIPEFTDVDFMLRLRRSDMAPKFNAGDVLACKVIDFSTFIQWNKPHVILTKSQGAMVKRIQQTEDKNTLLMISDNKEYLPFEVLKNECQEMAIIVGVVRSV